MSYQYQPIFEMTRGKVVESVHYGAIAVVDASGKLVASYGNPETITYLRSTAKPFQALPFIEMGGDTAFGLTPREIALMCASHSGTNEHVKVVLGMQFKIGVTESDLLCGTHPPFHEATAQELKKRGEEPTSNRHNCSGKHTGMLAHARLRELSIEDYIDPAHPIQQSILSAVSELCRIDVKDVETGIDGCSAPNFALPLYHAALGLARLGDPNGLPKKRAAACRWIASAMMKYPLMVAGPDQFDTQLMELGEGLILAKGGAEGYQGISLMPGALGPGSPALGIALKISDGDLAYRVRHPVALEVLRQLKALNENQVEALGRFAPKPVLNWRKLAVGESRTTFGLTFAN